MIGTIFVLSFVETEGETWSAQMTLAPCPKLACCIDEVSATYYEKEKNVNM